MATGVFVLKDKDTLVPKQAARFASEEDFQHLLASFPDLLAGDQSAASRRCVLSLSRASSRSPIAKLAPGDGRSIISLSTRRWV